MGQFSKSLKLEHQFLRVPFEHYKKTIRANHRIVEKEMSSVISGMSEAANGDLSREDAVQQLNSLVSRLQGLKRKISSARVREEVMQTRVNQLGEELETSKGNIVHLNEKLGAVEGAKEVLEIEMKKLRVQTEQWRKAADAAAAVLAGGVEMNGRRIPGRCGSMDKHYGSAFEAPVGGYAGFVGSPGLGDNDYDDGFGGKRKGGPGIRMSGDLWKKKSQK